MDIKLNLRLETGTNCELSSVANIISSYDATVDDSVIFFFENGFDINYSSEGVPNIKELKFQRNTMALARSFLIKHSIGYKYNNLKYTGISQVINFVKNSLKKNNPILAIVDSRLLTHNMVFQKNPGRAHIISITGFDDDGFIFSDCYVPTVPVSTYEGIISVDTLNGAWGNTGWAYIDIDYDKLRNTNFNITGGMICDSIRDNLNLYISEDKKISGISCLYTFADDISRFTDLFTKDDIQANIREISFNIYFYGIIPAYLLLKKVLLKLKSEYGYIIDNSIIEQIDGIVERWRKISFMLVKSGFRVSEDYFVNISSYIKETLDYERFVIKNILCDLN